MRFTPLLLAVFLVGCMQPLAKGVFQVEVINKTAQPLSVGFVKSGGPIEDNWIAPHQVAIAAPQLADRHWGLIIKPGEARTFGPQEGRFEEGSKAALRIYAGSHTVDELIAISRDDPDRLDLYLWPGRSSYVIRRVEGRLASERSDRDQP